MSPVQTFREWRNYVAQMIAYCNGKDVPAPPSIAGNRDCEKLVRVCRRFRDKINLDLDDWGLLEAEYAIGTNKTQAEIDATPLGEIVAYFAAEKPNEKQAATEGDAKASEGEKTTADSQKGKGKNVNARMLDAIQDDPEKIYLSSKQWADLIGCSKSVIIDSLTWKTVCKPARDREALSRGKRLRGARKAGRKNGKEIYDKPPIDE